MSIVATAMQPLISMYEAGREDKFEILFSEYGAFSAFRRQAASGTSLFSAKNRMLLENSWDNEVKIPVFADSSVSIGSTVSCSVLDAESTTAFVTPTFTPYSWGFTMYPGQYRDGNQAMNYVQYNDDFVKKADRCTRALMEVVDTKSRDTLELAKNTYWPANITTSYYPEVADALQITDAQKTDAFNQLVAVMKEFDFYDKIDLVASTSLLPLATRLENQGTGNAINEAFQFKLGAFSMTTSNRVTSGTGVRSTAYMLQHGAIDIVNRNNPECKAKMQIGGGDNPVAQWDTMMYPRLEMMVGTFYKAECAVAPGEVSVASNRTMKEHFSFDTQISWNTNYNSAPSTKQTPIVKVEFSAS